MENITNGIENQNIIFALDIGTRSVVGIVGVMEDDIFRVLDYEQRFHAKRAMRDGQIEDIALVARIVRDVKGALEKRLNISLTKVSIAAAGRSLKTKKILYDQEVSPLDDITQKLIQGAEYSALSQAMEEFELQDCNNKKFHCVGYSVTRTALDDYNMSNLVGHKGGKITLEIIAAFLPHNVIEGLYATMSMNDLEIENLTLEPMAAIHVIVPKDIRLLNIAIVDIGAGTSDIAICRNGGISAYDMVTIAGDEITEKLMQAYLVDFEQGENIKLSISAKNEIITYTDILGFENNLKLQEVIDLITPVIEELSKLIAQRILDVNQTSPVAVFIVGGASQVPGLCKLIAENLNIPENRVSIGGKQGFKYVKLSNNALQNPEFVTPVGIGAIATEHKGADFFAITVNENKIMLLRQGEVKVIEAILLAGIKPTTLIGVPQRPINYILNGEKKVFRADYTTGEIKINGESASIDSMLKRGDNLCVIPAKVINDGALTASTIKGGIIPVQISFMGEMQPLDTGVYVNDNIVNDDYRILNDDRVEIVYLNTIEDICRNLNIPTEGKIFTVNSEPAQLNTVVMEGDAVEYISSKKVDGQEDNFTITEEKKSYKINPIRKKIVVSLKSTDTEKTEEILQPENKTEYIQENIQLEVEEIIQQPVEEEIVIKEIAVQKNTAVNPMESVKQELENKENISEMIKELKPLENGYIPYAQRAEKGYILVNLNSKPTKIKAEQNDKAIFVNLLSYVNIENEEPGESLTLSINGKAASYVDEVSDGDDIIIKWD